ncbi:MAG TPA: efflux RND transporter permease subunit [Saprospiraceae bacterium]|nr:efflux RND transporter permease subunit [Saprospiraceae bacterium]HPI08506.1 efflux RND transporter permease subunit [Saprospiraceae bacterium]
MNITELAVKRPSLVVVVFSILTLLGLFSYSSLTYELLPKINSPVISVTTIYPGASPAEVENSVTKKIENEVASIENVDKINSTSLEGVSSVVVTLKYSADVDQSVQSAQRKVNAIFSQLPEGVKEPSVGKFSLDELPVMQIGATSDLSPTEFSDLLKNKIQPEIGRVEGVAKVDIAGDTKREIRVNVNSEKMLTYNLSVLQVTQAIASANLDFPTGKIKSEQSQLLVRLSGKLKTVNDLRHLVITTTQGGNPVYLSDVAEVEDGTADISTISRLNGEASVGLSVVKQNDGNAVEVSKLVKEKMAKLSEEYKDANLKFEIASDSSTFTLQAADAVIHDLLIAVILVALIMLFFLHSPRNATIVMVSIPLSIVATFIAMYALGYSLNLMSLLGLSLVVGILVDDSIVVLENIFTHIENGLSPWDASLRTASEIGLSVASITLVIVVVFLPILFVTGTVADLLKQFSVVIIVATLISLLVSFTVTPLLASRFTKVVHIDKSKWWNLPFVWFDAAEHWLDTTYRGLLAWSLGHKRRLMLGVFVLIVASFSLLTTGIIGSEFVAQGDNGEFAIEAKLAKDATIEQTNLVALRIENMVKKHPEVINVFTNVGSAASGFSSQSVPNALTAKVKMVPLENRAISSNDFSVLVKRELFNELPGVEIKVKAVGITGNSQAAVQVVVEGTDLDSIIAYGRKVAALVKSVPGTNEIETSVEGGNPELNVSIDRQRMADLNLSMDVIGATLQNSFAGNTNNKYSEGANEYDINIRLDAFNRKNPDDLLNIAFMNKQGQLIKLEQFAKVTQSFGPTKLERSNKVSSLTVGAGVVGRATGTVGAEVKAKIAQLEAPRGVTVRMGGDLENQQKSFASLGLALMMSLILVYLIMVALYDSYVYPFVVMFSVPVAIIGAFLALALSMQNMSIFSMLGMIMLIGLVVKNAILIVDNINHMKSQGTPLMVALTEGTMQRFRPILMTTIAMIFAMLPVALAKGAGADWKNGLAWVLVGGLTSSMLLTMLVVPAMYYVVDIIGEKISGKNKKVGKVPKVAVVTVKK